MEQIMSTRHNLDLNKNPSCQSFWLVTSIRDGQKINHFGPFYKILAHFKPFQMSTLSKMMVNFKIICEALDIINDLHVLSYFFLQLNARFHNSKGP